MNAEQGIVCVNFKTFSTYDRVFSEITKRRFEPLHKESQ